MNLEIGNQQRKTTKQKLVLWEVRAIKKLIVRLISGWGWSSVGECWPSICETMGLISITAKRKQKPKIIHNSGKPKAFLLRSGTGQGHYLSPQFFNSMLDFLTNAIRQKKNGNKRRTDWRGRNKNIFVSRWHNHLWRQCEIKQQQKLLELIGD